MFWLLKSRIISVVSIYFKALIYGLNFWVFCVGFVLLLFDFKERNYSGYLYTLRHIRLYFITLLDIDKLTYVLAIAEKLEKVLLNSGAFFIFEESKKSTASLATNRTFFV